MSKAVVRRRYDTSQRAERMAETREALIAAASALFSRQGLDAPSLDAICARAGYTRGAFYVHFRDRDELLDAVMERAGEAFLGAVLAPGSDPASLMVTVERFVSAMLRGEYPLTREGGVKPHQLLDACARSPRVRKRYVGLIQTTLQRLMESITSGQRAQLVRAELDAKATAQLLLAGVIGVQTMLELGIQLDPSQLAMTALGMLGRR